jgi:hypothetical protein
MQKLITTVHGLHTTAYHTVNQLAATNPSGHWTALKKLDFTKPLILLEKKLSQKTKYQVAMLIN